MHNYFHLVRCRQQTAVESLLRARWGNSGGGPGRGELRGQPWYERRLGTSGGSSGEGPRILEFQRNIGKATDGAHRCRIKQLFPLGHTWGLRQVRGGERGQQVV